MDVPTISPHTGHETPSPTSLASGSGVVDGMTSATGTAPTGSNSAPQNGHDLLVTLEGVPQIGHSACSSSSAAVSGTDGMGSPSGPSASNSVPHFGHLVASKVTTVPQTGQSAISVSMTTKPPFAGGSAGGVGLARGTSSSGSNSTPQLPQRVSVTDTLEPQTGQAERSSTGSFGGAGFFFGAAPPLPGFGRSAFPLAGGFFTNFGRSIPHTEHFALDGSTGFPQYGHLRDASKVNSRPHRGHVPSCPDMRLPQ